MNQLLNCTFHLAVLIISYCLILIIIAVNLFNFKHDSLSINEPFNRNQV